MVDCCSKALLVPALQLSLLLSAAEIDDLKESFSKATTVSGAYCRPLFTFLWCAIDTGPPPGKEQRLDTATQMQFS